MGGLQSGYARQYVFHDMMRVYLGGHLVSHLKLSLVEAARVLDDLSPWLKKNGYLSASAPLIPAEPGPCPAVVDHRIYFSPMPNRNGIAGPLFRYLIQSSVERRIEQTHPDQRVVESFTVLHISLDGTPLDEPDVLALIQLDGADSVLVHRLGDVAVDELRIGMRVKAVLEPRRKRKGSILDIRHFAPLES